MDKQDTKQTILQTGVSLIYRQGYNNTGLNEILDAAGVPKGSFYYYFNSKEDFGLQALDYFAARGEAQLNQYLTDESLDPLARLRAYFEAFAGYLESVGWSLGCLAGNLGQELADQNEAFRVKIDEVMSLWSNDIAACLAAAQKAGQISADLDIDELAAFCYNSWQGAMLRMKVTKSLTPLRLFTDTLFNVILKP